MVKCKDIGILIKQNSEINCLYMLPSRTFRTRRKSLRTSYTHSCNVHLVFLGLSTQLKT